MRKKKYVLHKNHTSGLSPLKQEILEQSMQGRSAVEIFRWLTDEKKVKTAYSSVAKFIKRNMADYQPPSGTMLIRQFLMLSPREQENVLTILCELKGKKFFQKNTAARKDAIPAVTKDAKSAKESQSVSADPDDFLKIKPGDSPAQIRLKKIAALDSTDLDHIPEELLKPLEDKKRK